MCLQGSTFLHVTHAGLVQSDVCARWAQVYLNKVNEKCFARIACKLELMQPCARCAQTSSLCNLAVIATGGGCRCGPLADLWLALRPQREGPDRFEYDKESGGAGPHLPRAHHAGAPSDPQTAPTRLLDRASHVAAAVPVLLLHLTFGSRLRAVAACIGEGSPTVCGGAVSRPGLSLPAPQMQSSVCCLHIQPSE